MNYTDPQQRALRRANAIANHILSRRPDESREEAAARARLTTIDGKPIHECLRDALRHAFPRRTTSTQEQN